MGGGPIDRQAFVVQHQQRPRRSASLLGPFLFLVVVGVLGFVGYKYVQANGMPELGVAEPSEAEGEVGAAQIIEKLEDLERRLQRIEARQNAATQGRTETKTAEQADEPDNLKTPAASSPSPKPPEANPRVAASQPPESPEPNSPARQEPSDLPPSEARALRSGVAANEEAWEATTDRLGDVIGELGVQRGAITQNREILGELQDQFARSYHYFRLHKRADQMQIGPVFIKLEKTDRKNQRYTVRLFVDDNWVEMKDRALHEPVEFYLAGVSVPLELVVSEIYQDEIVGRLALPRTQGRP